MGRSEQLHKEIDQQLVITWATNAFICGPCRGRDMLADLAKSSKGQRADRPWQRSPRGERSPWRCTLIQRIIEGLMDSPSLLHIIALSLTSSGFVGNHCWPSWPWVMARSGWNGFPSVSDVYLSWHATLIRAVRYLEVRYQIPIMSHQSFALVPGRFKVYYTLDFPPANWNQKKGFITADMWSRRWL